MQMTSYVSRLVSSVSRASPRKMCTFGFCITLMIHVVAGARHVEDQRLELDDIHALHRRDGAQPASRAARAEPNHQRASSAGVQNRAEQTAHHLRARVGARAAVGLAVHDERVPRRGARQRHAALGAVAVPDDRAPLGVAPVLQLIR